MSDHDAIDEGTARRCPIQSGGMTAPRVPPPSALSRLLVPFALGGTVLAFWWLRIVVPARGLTSSPPISGSSSIHLPLTLFGRLADGGLPLWNPYQLCGLPAFGAPEGGLFYPPHLLFLVLPPNVALAVLAIVHLLVVAYATAWFAGRIGVGAVAAMLARRAVRAPGTIRAWLFAPLLRRSRSCRRAIAIVELVRRPSAHGTAFLAGATAELARRRTGGHRVRALRVVDAVARAAARRSTAGVALARRRRARRRSRARNTRGGRPARPTMEMARLGTRAAHMTGEAVGRGERFSAWSQ